MLDVYRHLRLEYSFPYEVADGLLRLLARFLARERARGTASQAGVGAPVPDEENPASGPAGAEGEDEAS